MKIEENQIVKYNWMSIGYTVSDPDKNGLIQVQSIPAMLAGGPMVYYVDELEVIGYKEADGRLLKAWRAGLINGDIYYPARDQLLEIYMNGILGEFFDLFGVFWKIDDCYQFEGILE